MKHLSFIIIAAAALSIAAGDVCAIEAVMQMLKDAPPGPLDAPPFPKK